MKKETEQNLEKYMTLLKAFDPDLYDIKMALVQTKVNPSILPVIVRAIANLAYGTGYGKVQIFMQDGVITNINPEEKLRMDAVAVLIEDLN